MLRNLTKTNLLITLILAMTVLVYACRKDLLIPTDPTDPAYKMDVASARKIYNNLKKEKGVLVKPIITNGGALMSSSKSGVKVNNNNRRYALFQKAYESETERSTLVEIPIVYNQRYSLSVVNPKASVADRQLIFKYSFDRFLAYKNKSTGKISTRMLTYIPAIDYLKRHHNKITHNQINKLDADFSGYIEFKEWDGTGLYLLQYKNGKKIRYFSLKKAVARKASARSAKTENVTAMSSMDCEPELIEIWGEACVSAGPESPDNETCEPYLIDAYYVYPVCNDEPDPCLDYGICDTGDPCIDYGDCDGNDPGPTNPPDPQPQADITDNLTDPCLKVSLALAKDADFTNTVDSILKKLNGDANIKVSVIEKDTLMTGTQVVDGKTTNYSYQGDVFRCTIILNNEVLSAATQEYAVSVIIHEALHAFIQYDAGSTINHNLNHTQMAEKYVTPFADLLHSIYPDLSLRDATALAWGGLQKTPLWNTSMQNDTFSYGSGQSMTYSELQGVMTSHHFGYADGAHTKCGTKIN